MAKTVIGNQSNYDAANIQVLKGLEAVRRRPGMYVGGTDAKALHHLVYEIVDNSIDEALAGRCDRIEVTIHADSSVSVSDNGSGIPVAEHPTEKVSALQVVLTTLHAGGKFDEGAYKVSGGLHGVGAAAVNALSDYMEVHVRRNGGIWHQRYERGIPVKPVAKIKSLPKNDPNTGTTIKFKFDETIFKEDAEYRFELLMNRFREMAFVTRGVFITLRDERPSLHREMSFYFEGGLASFVRYLNRNRKTLHEPIYAQKEIEGIEVEVALQYTDGVATSEYAFANTIHTPDGGTHLTGLRSALTRVINNYARKNGFLKEKETNFSSDDTREGVTAAVSVKVPDPQFESQTKVKLMNTEVAGAVSSVAADALATFLEENPREGRRIIERCLTATRARAAARKARELVMRKSALESMTLPGKLADCSERDPTRSEVYIVEGDSAGGCFAGDTLVALADGRNLSFKEIVAEQAAGREHFAYTIRQNGQIGLERIVNARRTKVNAEVMRVTFDNSDSVICTPDHQFMLRDGRYKQAADLTLDDSLMPLYRKLSHTAEPGITIDGYEMAWDPRSESWLFTHLLADWYNRWQGVYDLESGDHCHHMDFSKFNNNPTNIERLPAEAHLALHRWHVAETLHRPDVIEKCRQIRQSDDFREMMSERMRQPETRQILSEQAKAQWEDRAYREYIAACWREFYDGNEAYQARNRAQLDRAQREYWSDEANRQMQADRVRNYFAANPDIREQFSQKAKEQWQDEELRSWRAETMRQQWTPEFRARRRAALNDTYYRKTMAALKQFAQEDGVIDRDSYRAFRRETRDKSLLKFQTFCERYFDGDADQAYEAVVNNNHCVVAIERLDERIDVYDIEIPGTHNFALASGVFVHNSAKQGRDRHFQAILPLRGKILNTERARLDKILTNNEVKALISALGVGIGESFDLSNLRYHRVIIMTDADVDGSHIRTLLLTFFFRYMPDLIEGGHLYIAQPPLYRVKAGKEMQYTYTEGQQQLLLKEWKGRKYDVQRYKGLGEMNPEQLWETTMNPENRTLLQVTIEDAVMADRTFDMLMGSEVAPRRRFITTHANEVRNLDV